MKRLHTGIIVLDGVDILCISFSAGSLIAYGVKRYRNYRRIKIAGEDPIVSELKRKSPINMFSEKGEPLKLPLMRGGDKIRGISAVIKNRKLARAIRALVNAKRSQKKIKLLSDILGILNGLLTLSVGLRFAVGGSLNYVQIILIAAPSTIGGFLMGTLLDYPLASTLLPVAILFGRGIEDIPDPYEKCRIICKAAAEYHNKQLILEMRNLKSLVEDAADALQLPIDKVPLICVENKLSLIERYKLRQLIQSDKAKKRVQHFSEFIKKFPECDASPEEAYREIIKRIEIKN